MDGPTRLVRRLGYVLSVLVLLLPEKARSHEPFLIDALTNKLIRDARLEAFFKGWEAKRTGVRDFRCEFEITTVDVTFKDERRQSGTALGIAPDLLRVDFREASPAKTGIQSIVFKEKAIEIYDMRTKQVGVVPRESPAERSTRWKLEAAERKLDFWQKVERRVSGYLNDFWWCTFWGMPVDELRHRYQTEIYNEDHHWLYLRLQPRSEEDRAAFLKIWLVVDAKTFAPRRWSFDEPIGNRVIVDLKKMETNITPALKVEDVVMNLPIGFQRIELKMPR